MHSDHPHGSVIRLNRPGEASTSAAPSPSGSVHPRESARQRPWRIYAVLALVGLMCVALGIFMAMRPQPVQHVTVTGAGTGPTTLSLDEVVAAVGSHIMLPQGETPTMAAVSDLTPLQGQAFFARASVGDIVLMYPKAQRAFLYSPKLGKLIEVAPLTLTQ